MRYRRYSKPQARTITVKYAGPCACCGATIPAGSMADYYPVGTIAGRNTAAIAHVGGLDGNSATCTVNIPYSWNLLSASTDKVSLSYQIIGGVPTTTVPLATRSSGQSLKQIAVPANGATTTETITATI